LREIAGERIVTLDILRGLAIVGMVFLHNAAFHFRGLGAALADPPPWLMAVGFLLLWAGLFGVVSGAANATTALRRLSAAARSPGERWRYPRSLVTGAFQTFAILFALHWVWTVGVGNSWVTEDPNSPELRATLWMGLLYFGSLPRIHPEIWVFASALWMIASNVLLVSLVFRWRYRHEPPSADDGLRRWLAVLAACVLLATPLLRALLYPPMAALVEHGGLAIVAAVPLALLVNDPNPVFPFFAYGLLGAIVGAALARNEPRPPLYRQMGLAGAVLVGLGGAGLAASGGVVLAGREEIFGQSALYFASLATLLLGVFAWLLVGLLHAFDPQAGAPWRPRWLRPVLRFGRVSLTVFLLEGTLAMGLRLALDAVRPGWNESLSAMSAFGFANLILWHVLLLAWERVDYRGSLEWWLARIRRTEDRARALRAT
jgi:uncharacterized membrane protein